MARATACGCGWSKPLARATAGAVCAGLCTFVGATAAPPEALTPTPGQNIVKAFPGSASVELYLPSAMETGDAGFLAWIGADSGRDEAIVRAWVARTAEHDSAWRAELFGPLQEAGSQYLAAMQESDDPVERARLRKALALQRDAKVSEWHARERALLVSVAAGQDLGELERESLADRVMLVRTGEALPGSNLGNPHLKPSIIRLLHAAAVGAPTPPEASAALRRLAVEHAPRAYSLRRDVLAAVAASAYRGHEAVSRAIASGESPAGAMAGVFRPIAHDTARLAALNRELAELACLEVPDLVCEDLRRSLLQVTYGALAEDLFACDAVESYLVPLIREEDRAAAAAMIHEAKTLRASMRDLVLADLDREDLRFLERGLVRDRDSQERFAKDLRAHWHAAYAATAQMVARLSELARPNPAWAREDLERADAAWKQSIAQRLQAVVFSGTLSSAMPHTRAEELVHGLLGERGHTPSR